LVTGASIKRLAPPLTNSALSQLLFRISLAAGVALAAKRALEPYARPYARRLAAYCGLAEPEEAAAKDEAAAAAAAAAEAVAAAEERAAARLVEAGVALGAQAEQVAESLEGVKALLRRVEAAQTLASPPRAEAEQLSPSIRELLREIREELRAERGTPTPADASPSSERTPAAELLSRRSAFGSATRLADAQPAQPAAPAEVAPHPPGYLSVLQILESGGTPPNIQAVDDKAKDNSAQPPPASLPPPAKPWERELAQAAPGRLTLTELEEEPQQRWSPPPLPSAAHALAARQLGLPGALSMAEGAKDALS
jgi:hypothetical protein